MFGKKTNKKPFGLKIQSATLATNYTPTIQIFKKSLLWFLSEDLFALFFREKSIWMDLTWTLKSPEQLPGRRKISQSSGSPKNMEYFPFFIHFLSSQLFEGNSEKHQWLLGFCFLKRRRMAAGTQIGSSSLSNWWNHLTEQGKGIEIEIGQNCAFKGAGPRIKGGPRKF